VTKAAFDHGEKRSNYRAVLHMWLAFHEIVTPIAPNCHVRSLDSASLPPLVGVFFAVFQEIPLIFTLRRTALIATSIAAIGATTNAFAQSSTPTNHLVPNIATGTAPVTLMFNGQTFSNQGLIAVGNFASNQIDTLGDTLGSFSSLSLDLSGWRRTDNGYSGAVLIGLPDRGYNAAPFFSDYAGRLHRFGISLTPSAGTAAAPANSLVLSYLNSQTLTDHRGTLFTGADPGASFSTVLGAAVPIPATGALGAGKISLDAEGLTYLADGSFYVSDEYASNVYYFDKNRKLVGIIAPPAALIPRDAAGVINFNSGDAPTPTQGRRNNQGMEGVSVTPDGKRLVMLAQSATIQDSTSTNVTRVNTRLMIYDISTNRTPTSPIAHYVLTLPALDRQDNNGGNATVALDRPAAQSELLALNGNQFLVLSRDGNGLGNGDTRPAVFKSILLVDTTGATNIAGTTYETSYTPVSPGGVLISAITAVKQSELVNMLNTTQLARFGVSLPSPVPTATTPRLSEKWEALGLAPALDVAAPNDYFLFVGNDNDFGTTTGVMQGAAYNAGLENPNQVLVYRLTLPTYVNPSYLAALSTEGAATAGAIRRSALYGAQAQTQALNQFALGEATRTNHGFADGTRGYVNGQFNHTDGSSYDDFNGNLGFEWALSPTLRFGASLSGGAGKTDYGNGSTMDVTRQGGGLHLRHRSDLMLSRFGVSYLQTNFDEILRADPFGMNAKGSTNGETVTGSAEFLFHKAFGVGNVQPYVGIDHFMTKTDGYTETGAAGGDIRYSSFDKDGTLMRAGLQWVGAADSNIGAWVPSGRVEYRHALNDDPVTETLTLSNVAHVDATQSVATGSHLKSGVGVQLQLNRVMSKTSSLSLGIAANDESGTTGYSMWVGFNFSL
jgi:uncharacterized protein YhjY with autotransporter beta-barrel domain